MQDSEEKVIYQGSPSQVVNLKTFAICSFLFVAAVSAPTLWDKFFIHHITNKELYITISKLMFFLPLAWGAYAWLIIKNHKYRITTERFMETTGIFSRTTNELELFRVRDITLSEPAFLRMFGCGNIVLDTSDKSTPVVALSAIKNPRKVLELLRYNVGIMRSKKGVREVEM